MGRSFFKNNLASSSYGHTANTQKKGAAPEARKQASVTSRPDEGDCSAEDGEKRAAAEDEAAVNESADGACEGSSANISGGPGGTYGAAEALADVQEKSRRAKIYDDVSVCKTLGIERWKLACARVNPRRGIDWDIVGDHAGMTLDWIQWRAIEIGIKPEEIAKLKPIEPDDGVVTCRIVGVWPNLDKVTVEVLSTGEREVATVPRIDMPPTAFDTQPMGREWQFDARRFDGKLGWAFDLNCVSYYRARV